tara:strand:+ start:258 stop:1310 length:1053 start_codon:yes stop_codon:yes gene_type:complete
MFKIIPYKNNIIKKARSIRYAMQKLNIMEYPFFLVIDAENKVIGSITDGDIRRAILKGLDIDSSVINCMNKKPKIANLQNKSSYDKVLKNIKTFRKFAPVIDSKKKIKFIIVEDLPSKKSIALIMAGGYGKRLGKMTAQTPKPLLKLGKRSILEDIIKKLENAKYTNIFISTYYLHQKIENFVKKRRSKSNIQILKENVPLGTAGSIYLIKNEEFEALTVINGDIISDINLDALDNFHRDKKNDITVSVADYSHTIPFGVIEFDKNHLYKKLEEKPILRKFILSGIYCLDKSVCNLVENKFLDMPDLIKNSSKLGKRIGVFPIYEYWNDIGTPHKFSLEKNRQKIKNNKN